MSGDLSMTFARADDFYRLVKKGGVEMADSFQEGLGNLEMAPDNQNAVFPPQLVCQDHSQSHRT